MCRKVFVSGCFDMLHSGHIAFLQSAAAYGELYVAVGSDQTLFGLKGRPPVSREDERLYMIQAIACVKEAFISRGTGLLDFADELRRVKPDVFVVNEDGNLPAKRALCESLGVEYLVLKRAPHADLPHRSTSALRQVDQMPFRMDLAGGWLDQPFVSAHYPGSVLTLSIEPTVDFNDRSGMATSTRRAALDIWGLKLPAGDPAKVAKLLFCYDNPPGTTEISGSQDAIGIVFPGLARSSYAGEYWPTQIETCCEERVLQFIERALYLVPIGPRGPEFDVLGQTQITAEAARALAEAADACWEAALACDVHAFGRSVRASFEAQTAMFPRMVTPLVEELIGRHRGHALGWKLSGAGGGGYLILVADRPIDGGFQILARRPLV